VLAEYVFVGRKSWQILRSQVQEKEVDRLIHNNLFLFSKVTNELIGKLEEFLGDSEQINSWDDADRLINMLTRMGKVGQSLKVIQEHRLPDKAAGSPLLEEDLSGDDEEFIDEYAGEAGSDHGRSQAGVIELLDEVT